MNGDDTPATKADMQAILTKLDSMATKDDVATAFTEVSRRLDVLSKELLLVVQNLGNNVKRIDESIEDHDKRLQAIGA